MDLDKQHAALEKIFEFLFLNGRKDLVDAYNEAAQAKETEKICTARKKWKCCKCRKPILPTTKYFCITYTTKSSFLSKRFCLECISKNKKNVTKQTSNKMKFIRYVK